MTAPAQLAARLKRLGQRVPEHETTVASICRLLLGGGTMLDRARVVAVRRSYGEDPVADAVYDAGVVALLIDEGDPLAEAWLGEASRSLTRAGVPL